MLRSLDGALSWSNEPPRMECGRRGEDRMSNREMTFTGRVFVYSEDLIEANDREAIMGLAAELGLNVKFRDQRYADERNKGQRPFAFISHDSKDKHEIAGPLARELEGLLCPVWYDEYSLPVGSSIRDQIEKGLRECSKCILILTPNYLSNQGWARREFDSVFTRELVECKNVILPVWHDVSREDVYKCSLSLADRVAVKWTEGVEAVAKKLRHAIGPD
ncbi:MAG: toll/interleukin-1 receptor domain-containing protein [Thermodesulfobacteriota bacterium]